MNPRARCPRCGGWLARERYAGLTIRRCVACGRTPDVPTRPPTRQEMLGAGAKPLRVETAPWLRLRAAEKRQLADMLDDLGLPAPAEWRSAARGRKPAPPPVLVAPVQLPLFDLGEPVATEPRRRGPRRKRPPAAGVQLSFPEVCMMPLQEVVGDQGPGWGWRHYKSPVDDELRVTISLVNQAIEIDIVPEDRYQVVGGLDDFLGEPITPRLLDQLGVVVAQRLAPAA